MGMRDKAEKNNNSDVYNNKKIEGRNYKMSEDNRQQRLDAVREFADNVLKYGRDSYAKERGEDENSPLFADGIDLESKKHLKWRPKEGKPFVVCNPVNQQNLFRTLLALSRLTGDSKYREAAANATSFHLRNFQDKSGLLQWGGHRVINLEKLSVNGNKGMKHELKNSFPYYEFMYQVEPERTVKFIKAFWNAHVFDWENLEISRHGDYGEEIGKLWEHDFNDPEPFRETKGLSFLSAGNDLIYSAAMLYELTGDRGALKWAKNLAYMYVKARHPETNLGSYKYTQAMKRAETDDFSKTNSHYGDRAQRQFGPEFGPVALEGYMLRGGEPYSIYVINALMELQLVDDIGEEVEEFLDWTLSGLKAYKNYAYQAEENVFKSLIADGTDLTGYILPRDGYYGKKGMEMKAIPADSGFFYSYVRAYQQNGEDIFWDMVRSLAKNYGLGNLGDKPGRNMDINLATKKADPELIFGLSSLYHTSGVEEYLELAEKIADNIVEKKFRDGFFISDNSRIILFDIIDPLAVLALEAELRGGNKKVANYILGIGSKQSRRHYVLAEN